MLLNRSKHGSFFHSFSRPMILYKAFNDDVLFLNWTMYYSHVALWFIVHPHRLHLPRHRGPATFCYIPVLRTLRLQKHRSVKQSTDFAVVDASPSWTLKPTHRRRRPWSWVVPPVAGVALVSEFGGDGGTWLMESTTRPIVIPISLDASVACSGSAHFRSRVADRACVTRREALARSFAVHAGKGGRRRNSIIHGDVCTFINALAIHSIESCTRNQSLQLRSNSCHVQKQRENDIVQELMAIQLIANFITKYAYALLVLKCGLMWFYAAHLFSQSERRLWHDGKLLRYCHPKHKRK